MRISTSQFYQSGLNSILDQQSGLNRTQEQISTGLRVMKPSDDPIASISIINLEQEIALTNRYIANGDIATANLNVEETTLQGFTNILQRVRELILSGGNATYGETERSSLAVEMNELLDQMVGFANFKNSSGDYLFSGNKIDQIPFTKQSAGNFSYNGDQGVRNIQVSTSTQVEMNDSGYQIFQNILNGNGTFTTQDDATNTGTGIINAGTVLVKADYLLSDTPFTITFGAGGTTYSVLDNGNPTVPPLTNIPYSDGDNISFNGISLNIKGSPATGDVFTVASSRRQDIFETVQNTIDALKTTDDTQRTNALDRVLGNLDQGMKHIGSVHAEVGTRLNILQNQNLINNDFMITSKISLSKVRDLDLAEAITDLNLRKVGLEAAQSSFVRIQNLSLFNFLR